LVHWTPWAREEYQELLTTARNEEYFKKTGDPLEDARRLLIRLWMAHGGRISYRTSWRHNVQAKVGNTCAKVWHDIPERILITAQRLKDAQIECRPALELIDKHRYSEVLIYADPPYVLNTRKRKRQYKHEMTDADHIALIDALNAHPGPVLLSGYACSLYDQQLRRWERKTCSALAEGGRKREEVLWLNQIAVKALDRQNLFRQF
jgi:DNA adenine methylase